MSEKKLRLTRTADGDIVPDELVRDLSAAGWKMRTYHAKADRANYDDDVIVTHTLPSRFLTSLSNMFVNMETKDEMLMDDDKIYRIELDDSKKVIVKCYGIDSIDSVLQPYYSSVDDLPQWVQKKLAVLYLLDPDKVNQDIEKVGRRINRNVFWIYPE